MKLSASYSSPLIFLTAVIVTHHSAAATPINANRPDSFDDGSQARDTDDPSSYTPLTLIVSPAVDGKLAIDIPWTRFMSSDASFRSRSPLASPQEQEEQVQEQELGQQQQEAEQIAEESEEESGQDQGDIGDTSDTSNSWKSGRILVGRKMFSMPRQRIQEAELVSIAEFMDMGDSAVECQFEADGDGVGPIFGFGDKIYPDEFVDGIECSAWISDRDDWDDEIADDWDDELDMVIDEDAVEDGTDGYLEEYPSAGSAQSRAWEMYGLRSGPSRSNADTAGGRRDPWDPWGLKDVATDDGAEADIFDAFDDVIQDQDEFNGDMSSEDELDVSSRDDRDIDDFYDVFD